MRCTWGCSTPTSSDAIAYKKRRLNRFYPSVMIQFLAGLTRIALVTSAIAPTPSAQQATTSLQACKIIAQQVSSATKVYYPGKCFVMRSKMPILMERTDRERTI